MIAFLRMLIPLMIVLTIVYVGISIYSRARRKARLAQEWDHGPKDVDREAFIDTGLEHYSQSFRRRLILLVYILPLVLIAVMVYLTNYR
ncbi:MAG: hypothetical protein ACWA5A_10400 [Marinibacterium sp.]